MPRTNALPRIDVPTEKVTKRLALDQADVNRLEAYSDFYQEQTGGGRPELEQTVIGIVRDHLDRNRAFVQFERARATAKPAAKKGKATAAPTENPNAADNG